MTQSFFRVDRRIFQISPPSEMKGAWAVLNLSVPENSGAVGLWLRQVDENKLFVIDVDGHVTIEGLGIIEPTRFSGSAAVYFGMRFTGSRVKP